MAGKRYLVVTADDFGIGDATSQAILDLAAAGRVTGSVLLVTSPHAETAVNAWRRGGRRLELGWHPCLTLDQPISVADTVPSLVDSNGLFLTLGKLVKRLWNGRIRHEEIERELRAQYERFKDLVGQPPPVVNAHHHVQVFHPVGEILQRILADQRPAPYIRRIREPWRTWRRVPGARLKRAFLNWLGRRDAALQARNGFTGNDWLAGITDPACVADPHFLTRWLSNIPGQVVELTCHPGYFDASLIGRDCTRTDGQLQRRIQEFALLSDDGFPTACRQAGFTLISPASLNGSTLDVPTRAA